MSFNERLVNASASFRHYAVSRVIVTRGRPEELLGCRAEVAAGQAMQVQQRQHLGHPWSFRGPVMRNARRTAGATRSTGVSCQH